MDEQGEKEITARPKTVISDKIRATVIDYGRVQGMAMREEGQRVHSADSKKRSDNLCFLTGRDKVGNTVARNTTLST